MLSLKFATGRGSFVAVALALAAGSASAIQPTHVLDVPAGATIDFSTGSWTPGVPPIGGDASTVLGLDFNSIGPGWSTVNNDLPGSFKLSGFVFTSNGDTSDRTHLTGSGYLLVDGAGESRIEQRGLSRVVFQAPVQVDESAVIYNPSIGTTQFDSSFSAGKNVLIDGFVWDDISTLASTFVRFGGGAAIANELLIRGGGLEVASLPLVARSVIVEEKTSLEVDLDSTTLADLIDDATPLRLVGGRLEAYSNSTSSNTEFVKELILAKATASEVRLRNFGGFEVETLTREQNPRRL